MARVDRKETETTASLASGLFASWLHLSLRSVSHIFINSLNEQEFHTLVQQLKKAIVGDSFINDTAAWFFTPKIIHAVIDQLFSDQQFLQRLFKTIIESNPITYQEAMDAIKLLSDACLDPKNKGKPLITIINEKNKELKALQIKWLEFVVDVIDKEKPSLVRLITQEVSEQTATAMVARVVNPHSEMGHIACTLAGWASWAVTSIATPIANAVVSSNRLTAAAVGFVQSQIIDQGASSSVEAKEAQEWRFVRGHKGDEKNTSELKLRENKAELATKTEALANSLKPQVKETIKGVGLKRIVSLLRAVNPHSKSYGSLVSITGSFLSLNLIDQLMNNFFSQLTAENIQKFLGGDNGSSSVLDLTRLISVVEVITGNYLASVAKTRYFDDPVKLLEMRELIGQWGDKFSANKESVRQFMLSVLQPGIDADGMTKIKLRVMRFGVNRLFRFNWVERQVQKYMGQLQLKVNEWVDPVMGGHQRRLFEFQQQLHQYIKLKKPTPNDIEKITKKFDQLTLSAKQVEAESSARAEMLMEDGISLAGPEIKALHKINQDAQYLLDHAQEMKTFIVEFNVKELKALSKQLTQSRKVIDNYLKSKLPEWLANHHQHYKSKHNLRRKIKHVQWEIKKDYSIFVGADDLTARIQAVTLIKDITGLIKAIKPKKIRTFTVGLFAHVSAEDDSIRQLNTKLQALKTCIENNEELKEDTVLNDTVEALFRSMPQFLSNNKDSELTFTSAAA